MSATMDMSWENAIYDDNQTFLVQKLTWWSLTLFLIVILVIALCHGRTLFWDSHGWRHRLAGGALLSWLLLGCVLLWWDIVDQEHNKSQNYSRVVVVLAYDIGLGLWGIAATLTAARDFPHKHVRNVAGQSGTLAERAIVTQAEMVEHSFYQGLNLWQALYLHFMAGTTSPTSSLGIPQWFRNGFALWLVTAPWYLRNRFPVHSFSNNWKRSKYTSDRDSSDTMKATQQHSNFKEATMYKIKKWQYVFYKHVILHGLNISICLQQRSQQPALPLVSNVYDPEGIVYKPGWRLFWIALNAAYVLEFFLQSLVKRKILSQSCMLMLNQSLMLISSLAALQSVLRVVQWPICLVSVLLNFANRHHDIFNTILVYTVFQCLQAYQEQ